MAALSATAVLSPGQVTAAGWSYTADRTTSGGRTYVYWRYATATDPINWVFTVASATNVAGTLSTYRNPIGGAPISVAATGSVTLSTTHPLPQVTTTGDAQQLVHIVGIAGNATGVPPTGTAQRAVIAAGASLLVADRYQSKPGTSSALSANTGASRSSASITIALKPLESIQRFGHNAHSDNPSHLDDTAGNLLERYIGLPGGAMITITGTNRTWSYPNIHGDVIATADNTGTRTWIGWHGPYGEIASGTTPANTTPAGTRYGWHGQQQRLTDRGITHMGARPYVALIGRFLRVDPVEGGCANDYTYGFGDPVNENDLLGTGIGRWLSDRWKDVQGFAGKCWKGFGKVWAPVLGGGFALWAPWDLAAGAEAAGLLGPPSGAAAIAESAGGITAASGSAIFGAAVIVAVVGISCVAGHRD